LLRAGPVDPHNLANIADAVGVDTDEVVDAQWVDNGPGWLR
jgi:hypothetical protein